MIPTLRALSLIVAIALAAISAASGSIRTSLGFCPRQGQWSFDVDAGDATFETRFHRVDSAYDPNYVLGGVHANHELLGFRISWNSSAERFNVYSPSVITVNHETYLRAPAWAVVLLFAAWPLLSFVSYFRRRRRARRRALRGLCITCGYNLTGLTEPRCPECGSPIAHRQQPALAR